MILLRLGAVPFFSGRGPGFNKLRRSREYRIASHARIERPLAKQWMGQGDYRVELDGVIMTPLRPVSDLIEQLARQGDQGRHRALATGYGEVLGMFLIEQIMDEQTYFLPNGQPQKYEFNLVLTAYGPESGGPGFSVF